MKLKLNHLYIFKLATSYESRKLKPLLTNTLGSSETRMVYYLSGLEIKKNKNIVFTLLSKVRGGYIAYFCNYVYGVGEFVLITDKELETITTKWDVTPHKEKKVIINQWRYFWYLESIISEFVHPLDSVSQAVNELGADINSKESQLASMTDDLQKLQKRFA